MKWTSRPLHSFWAKGWRNVYRDIPEDMRTLIEPIVADHGLELVDVEHHQGRPPWTLRVIVDTEGGDGRVPIERCADVSREIAAQLDAKDAIPVRYQLEVSSPGLDRVLAREKDFARACGREIRLETRAPLDGRRRFRGTPARIRRRHGADVGRRRRGIDPLRRRRSRAHRLRVHARRLRKAQRRLRSLDRTWSSHEHRTAQERDRAAREGQGHRPRDHHRRPRRGDGPGGPQEVRAGEGDRGAVQPRDRRDRAVRVPRGGRAHHGSRPRRSCSTARASSTPTPRWATRSA